MKPNLHGVPEVSLPMVEEILAKIRSGEFAPDLRLSPTRDLARQYGISYVSASKALAVLAREGLIRRHIGRGTFVNEPGVRPSLTAATFVLFGRAEAGAAVGGMVQAFAEQVQPAGYRVSFLSVPYTQPEQDLAAQLLREDCRAVAIAGNFAASLCERLRDAGLIVAAIGRAGDKVPGINVVTFDREATAFMAARVLQREGYENVFLIETAAPGAVELRNGYLLAMHVSEAEFRRRQPSGVADDSARRAQAEAVARLIHQQRRPAAILACGQAAAGDALRALAGEELAVPEDVAIVSIGENDFTGGQFATWAPPGRTCGREAGQMILDAARGQPAARIVVADQFYPGFSLPQFPQRARPRSG